MSSTEKLKQIQTSHNELIRDQVFKRNARIIVKPLKLKQVNKLEPLKQKNTSRNSKAASSDRNRLTTIRCKSFDTTQYDKRFECFVQKDDDFVDDIKAISDSHQDLLKNILALKNQKSEKKFELTEQDFDTIDFIARKHYKANQINQSQELNQKQKDKKDQCPCGCQRHAGQKIPFWSTSIKKIQSLGAGAILIFMFIQAYALMMFLAFIIYGIFAIVTNQMGGESPYTAACTDRLCKFTVNSTNNNKIWPHYMMVIQWWLGLGFCVVWLLITRGVKYYGIKKNNQIDKKLISASDKAIMIMNLPREQYSQVQLFDYFQKIWSRYNHQLKLQNREKQRNIIQIQSELQENGNNFNMKYIQIIYQMNIARQITTKIIDLSKTLTQMLEQVSIQQPGKKKIIGKKINNQKQYILLKKQLIENYENLGDLRNKFLYDENFRKSISSQVCIVEFNTEEDKNLAVKILGNKKLSTVKMIQQSLKNFILCEKKQYSLKFKGKSLQIIRAPEPSDINWTKCELPASSKLTIGLYLLTVLIVICSLGMVLALQKLQQFINAKSKEGVFASDSSILTLINIGTSILLLIVNKFLWFSIQYLIEIEINYTESQRINSHMNKALFATSINIIMLPIITNYVFRGEIYGIKGLEGMVFDYQFTTFVVGLPLKLINPIQLIKRLGLFIRCIRNRLIKWYCGDVSLLDQNFRVKGIQSVNKLYEGQNFDVAESYVYIISTLYHSAFFCQLQPVVLLTGTLITGLFYLVLKAKLFIFANRPKMLDLAVFQTALSQVVLVPVIYGAGAITLTYIEHQVDNSRPIQYYQSGICIGLGFLFFFNPKNIFGKSVKCIIEYLQSIEWLKKEKKQKKEQKKNQHNYFKNSNSLSLLGFQNKLRAINFDEKIYNELQKFCSQFFPKQYEMIKNWRKQEQQNEQDQQDSQVTI